VGDLPLKLTVAVMGCVVNGPGEAREADIGVAGGDGAGALFVKGEPPRKVEGDLAEALIAEIRRIAGRRESPRRCGGPPPFGKGGRGGTIS